MQPIQMQLSKNLKIFSEYLAQFLGFTSNILKKKMTLVAYKFSKLLTLKFRVR